MKVRLISHSRTPLGPENEKTTQDLVDPQKLGDTLPERKFIEDIE